MSSTRRTFVRTAAAGSAAAKGEAMIGISVRFVTERLKEMIG